MNRLRTLEDRIAYRIARSRDRVFVRDDFEDLGGYDQIGRCLRQLVAKDRLIKLGYGVYARARRSSISGEPMLDAPNGFAGVVREALNKLGCKWAPTRAETSYNAGRSTQVPVNAALKIKDRFSRKLSYKNMELMRAA